MLERNRQLESPQLKYSKSRKVLTCISSIELIATANPFDSGMGNQGIEKRKICGRV